MNQRRRYDRRREDRKVFVEVTEQNERREKAPELMTMAVIVAELGAPTFRIYHILGARPPVSKCSTYRVLQRPAMN